MKSIGKLTAGRVMAAILAGLAYPANSLETRPQTNDPLGFVIQVEDVGVTDEGTVELPTTVYKAQSEGKYSDVLQYVLTVGMMDECIADVVNHPPGQRDPYLTEWKYFKEGICKIKNCYLQSLAVSMLSGTSKNERNGGSQDAQDRQSASEQATILLSGAKGCGDDDSSAADPVLLALLQQQQQQQQNAN